MDEKVLAACFSALLLLAACTHEVFYNYEGAKISLFDVAREPAGANCATGGQRLHLGTDENQDGYLSSDEVISTHYVCDGASGGLAQIFVTDLIEGSTCPYGGQRIDLGIDADGNGALSAGEIEASHYVCNDSRADGWSQVTQLSASADFTCALLANRDVACWGLSPDRRDQSVAPAVVTGLSKAVAVGPGCALISDGTVECWSGIDADPRRVPNLFSATAIAGSTATHACAVLEDETAACWGNNEFGQLGNGTAVASSTPVPVFDGSGERLNGISQIAVGARHSCAVLKDGRVACWGDNASGQLGNGDLSVAASGGALLVQGLQGVLEGVSKIALGDDHSCALLSDGMVQCWGRGEVGQLGDGERADPTAVAGPVLSGSGFLSGVADLSAGSRSTCAVMTSGEVRCWGDNDRGQLGDRTRLDHSAAPVQVKLAEDGSALTGVRSIALGSRHACALTSTGKVYCWGRNRHGQMGNGQSMGFELYSTHPVPFDAGRGAALSLGELHGCMSRGDGTVACWGINERGQLGARDGNAWLFSASPLDVAGLPAQATLVASGPAAAHTCAILRDDTAACWGANGSAQLGDGSSTLWKTPVQVMESLAEEESQTPAALLTGIKGLAVGRDHTCALLKSDQGDLARVACWGGNSSGQLGNGTSVPSAVPVTVQNSVNGDVMDIVAGDGFTCWLTSQGAVRCSGKNAANSLLPSQVSGLTSGAQKLAAGGQHACVVTSDDGRVLCWGNNASGQIGNGTSATTLIPRSVSGLSNVSALALGYRHSCAVVNEAQDSTVWCWGNNAYGQLGDGTTTSRLAPVKVPGLLTAVSVSCGTAHTCATLIDGSTRCWGWNGYGQLGAFPGQLGAVEGAIFP